MLTEFGVRCCLKLSLIVSTVDWIEGSKNAETCALYGSRLGANPFVEWVQVYPVSINLPDLIPYLGSLSRRPPNLTY